MALPRQEREQLENSQGHWLDRDSIVPKVVELIRMAGLDPSGLTLLDVGCAVGREVEGFNSSGLIASGLDINPKYIATGLERNPKIKIREGDMANLPSPFGEASFDIVTCFNTLFYGDTGAVLPRLVSTVRLGGVVVATLDEKILRQDTNSLIHQLEVNELLKRLPNVEVLHKTYAERDDKEPWPHRHHFYTVVLKRIGTR